MNDRPAFEPPEPEPPPEEEPVWITSEDDTTWALVGYLGVFAFWFVAPLVVFSARRNRSPFVRFHSVQALNLGLTGPIVFVGGLVLSVVTSGLGLILAIPVVIALVVAQAAYLVVAAVQVGRREPFRIPAWLCWRMVR